MNDTQSLIETHREEQRQLLENYRLFKQQLESIDRRLDQLDVILSTLEREQSPQAQED